MNKQGYCCNNPPHVCAPFDRGCNTPCLYMNATLSCKARMAFIKKFSMKEKDDACLASYWMVMDKCPVCHHCKAEDAGCKPSDWSCSGDPDKDKWSDKVREFCCLKTSKGCPKDFLAELPEVPLILYDCEDHAWDWEAAWSVDQKEWCCKHHKRGCKDMSNSGDPPKMQAGMSEEDFSELAKKEAALERAGLPLDSLMAPLMKEAKQLAPKVDDYKDYSDFLPAGAAKPYHCEVALNNWETAWSLRKREWCCKHEHLGCDATPSSGISSEHTGAQGETDCTAGFDNWETTWTYAKKQACCQSVGVGCPSAEKSDSPESSSIFFDCSKGYPGSWSQKKKEVCCNSGNIGCGS